MTDYILLYNWLKTDQEITLPGPPSHYIACGGVIINE
jgi:hypothetical protein